MATNDDEARILDQWTHKLTQALQILDLKLDQELILELARKSADSVTHAAAPITAFLVGYAAALEAGTGSAGSKTASTASITKAADVAFSLCEDARQQGNPHPEPGAKGWTHSAQ
ncbi:DUF6457 domain-containing protein [Pseudarthrobacter sulfonivorans]|uniref:DUF6457 domain-containing protein n=1 Tax=Pseudarthrobacter sulfonivorans TaxID=121292 RepID=UPI00210289D4|nr:DUF6457 domain-containing protein [Pseudarthrobacter sulfonivorans]